MQRLQAFTYERMPTGEQQRQMRRFAGSCRFVFNQALAWQKERYERAEKNLAYVGQPFVLPPQTPGGSPARLLPLPHDCSERLRIPGLPDGTAFHTSAMDGRVAQGDVSQPGPAAADFGNGLGWILPAERYLFANAAMSLHLHLPPEGEGIGEASETQADGSGAGTTLSRLYDIHGPVGVAVQSLVLPERNAATPTAAPAAAAG